MCLYICMFGDRHLGLTALGLAPQNTGHAPRDPEPRNPDPVLRGCGGSYSIGGRTFDAAGSQGGGQAQTGLARISSRASAAVSDMTWHDMICYALICGLI